MIRILILLVLSVLVLAHPHRPHIQKYPVTPPTLFYTVHPSQLIIFAKYFSNAGQKMTQRSHAQKNNLFYMVHPSHLVKFSKYFFNRGSNDVHQPDSTVFEIPDVADGFDFTDEDLPDLSQCAPEIPDDEEFLISASDNCPLMTYDQAQNFCFKRDLKPVSIWSHRHNKAFILDIANFIEKGFWTNGFIQPESSFVEWNDVWEAGEEVVPDLWAEGQPDGTKMDQEDQVQFCIAVQKAGTSGKLFDKACNEKKAVVCERK